MRLVCCTRSHSREQHYDVRYCKYWRTSGREVGGAQRLQKVLLYTTIGIAIFRVLGLHPRTELRQVQWHHQGEVFQSLQRAAPAMLDILKCTKSTSRASLVERGLQARSVGSAGKSLGHFSRHYNTNMIFVTLWLGTNARHYVGYFGKNGIGRVVL